MKRLFLTFGIAAAVVLAGRAAIADKYPELNDRHHFADKAHAARPGGGGQNLVNHGGPVIVAPRVVAIFWGPSWSSGGADGATAQHIRDFFGQFGSSGHLAMLPQYSNAAGQVASNMLADWWNDTGTPPTNVTDVLVQQEVLKYLGTNVFDSSVIYEVFLPPSSYSSDGTGTSCGGPNLAYCAYHGHFSNGGRDIKYSSMPYPSCGGCISNSGWSAGQNIDHFSCHETREAITDEDLNAWYDRRGNEADDKCAWSPTPFLDSGFGYQYEWSNSAGGCVR